MKELNNLTLEQAHKGLVKKEFSAAELADACLNRIEKRQKEINAFITVTSDIGKEKANKTDEKIKLGDGISILEGIPCAIKDNILVKNIKCTAGSKMLLNYIGGYNATVIDKLDEKGYVLLGKTNMDEFAMGSSCENSYFGPTKNPHNLEKVPGGSSGGSAAAVADNQCIYALGSDTGGSIRQPAALCGVVGLKPTYGRVSRNGLIAMTSSFDQIGPITKTVKDAAMVFENIYGYDEKDATSVDINEKEDFLDIKKDIKNLKVGISDDFFIDQMDIEIKEKVLNAVKILEKNGATVINVKMPHISYSLPVYYMIMFAEVSSNLARFDGLRYGYFANEESFEKSYEMSRMQGFGDEVKRRIILGTYILSAGYYDAYYKKAQKVRSLIINDFNEAFSKVDCLITPTTPAPAFNLGLKINDPITMYLEDIFTVSINVAGLPAISIPCGQTSGGLPIGMQIIGKHFDEKTLFQVGYNYEKFTKK